MRRIQSVYRPAVFIAVLTIGCLLLGAAAQPFAPAARPSPKLSPTDVVRAQLAALRSNDMQIGIRRAYRFASPATRRSIGTSRDFATMLRQQYADMLTQTHARVKLKAVAGNRAAVLARLRQATGRHSAYLFELSRQHDGACRGCWKTDGVIALKPVDNEPLYSI